MTQAAFCQMNVPGICMTQSAGKHHRQRRGEGDDSPVNLIEACPACHDWTHKHPGHARQLGWIVPTWGNPETVPVLGWQPLIDDGGWEPADPAKAQPQKPCPKCKGKGKIPDEPAAEKIEKPRQRAVVGIRVPKDELEDGAEVLLSLIQVARENLMEVMGWKEDVPAYYVLVAVLHEWMMSGYDSHV